MKCIYCNKLAENICISCEENICSNHNYKGYCLSIKYKEEYGFESYSEYGCASLCSDCENQKFNCLCMELKVDR